MLSTSGLTDCKAYRENMNLNRNNYWYLNGRGRMAFKLLAEDNVVKENPEDDVFQNIAAQRHI